MQIFVNTLHTQHTGQHEMFRGQMVPCHEVPARLDHVLAELAHRPVGPMLAPPAGDAAFDAALQSVLGRVHHPGYLTFLAQAWAEWVALDATNAQRDALPSVWPLPNRHGFSTLHPPRNFAARLGMYAFDAGTPLMAGSWAAAQAGAACALAAAQAVLADMAVSQSPAQTAATTASPGQQAQLPSALALTRPPGHHAGPDFMGGYCFLNNAAVAAQTLLDGGCTRVAVLDVDYHHGNGTQTIFYERADVLTVSIHGDPATEYPFYLGHADEVGAGAGEGFNLNLPLSRGSGADTWFEALDTALARIHAYQPQACVVPLGLDTFAGDPISGFRLQSADYLSMGRRLASLNLPTVFTFEGGYAVAEVGVNAVNVLLSFVDARPS
ncbi:MAG TPA: histone deacetylase family protein [Burkholderiaceae bacterium]|nr:histone deacetylase family protein [Burkholderiaceae bacterium]